MRLLLVISATLILAGCGGGSTSPPRTATPAAPATTDTPPKTADAPEPDTMASDTPPQDTTTPDTPTAEAPPIELRNRLAEETSPYLLQHQHNPVHWFPWGPEAFEAARKLDRLIFLSVGYSTCYWCHVMERESFEDEATAAIMNEHFVCIKVDREERPDVDDIYMAAVQAQNQGHGGWPMSVFIEPHTLKPFLSGTYFPPEGPRAFKGVLEQVAGYWRDRRQDVMTQCDAVAEVVSQRLAFAASPQPLGTREVEKGVSDLLADYDREHAGFVGNAAKAPKFPTPVTLDYLIGTSWDLQPVRQAVIHTLDRMATGGMYDQVGGGFHRYSVDREWLVPHFEKMLYDNGQLASTYADVYTRTNDPYYAQVVREVLDYVLEHMTGAEGAFYSAQDAEVNHREGQNYLWTEDEIRAALTDAGLDAEIEFALDVYGFTKGTNFTDPHHPEDGPKNVVFLVERPDAAASRLGLTDDEFAAKRTKINEALLAVRDGRDQPITDDKILTAWNGLMIKGFADGGRVLNEFRYRSAASKAADSILDRMRSPDGRGLLRTSRNGEAKIDAFCEDYAAFVRGLLAVHRASRESKYLEAAEELMGVARERFWDQSAGGFFDTVADRDDLFVRTKSSYDGALPSANSMMVHNLLDLHEATGESRYLDDAVATVESLSAILKQQPRSSELTTLAVHRLLESHPERLGGQATAQAASDLGGKKIRVTTSTRTVRLSPDAAASVDVTIELAKGWHVNAHKPGIEFLIPLEIVVTGASGVEVDVDYPAGEAYDGPEGKMMVHHGRVTIPVRIRQTGTVSGRPQLVIKYQMCDDQMCLAPESERLPVGLIVGGS